MRDARRVFALTLGLNLLVSIGKLICGFLTSTLSMIADGFHSLLDASSNIIGMIGITIALEPPDAEHPYGHRKFEALAAICISFMMFFACFNIVKGVFDRLVNHEGHPPEVGAVSYAVMIITLLINIGVTRYESRRGEELDSELLKADAAHTLSDVFVSLGVVAALIAAQFQIYIVDVLASLVIIALIFKAGYGIVERHIGPLVDAAAISTDEVRALVLSVPGVVSCHKIRSRGTPDHVFLDLHVQVDGDLTVREGHEIAYAVEAKLEKELTLNGTVDVVVHIEDAREEEVESH